MEVAEGSVNVLLESGDGECKCKIKGYDTLLEL